MTLEWSGEGSVAVVHIAGRMDAVNAEQFDQACRESIRGGTKRLVVDFAKLDYVSSMGLRSILAIAKTLQASGGKMVLCGMRGLVKEVFDMTRLTPLFPVFDSVEAALKSE
jgi:anti-anti-sigma factor